MQAYDKKKIMELIAQKKLTAEEGYRLYMQQMASSSVDSTTANNYVKNSTVNEEMQSTHTGEAVSHELRGTDIAVIGMSGQFPGASNVEEYWDNLIHGRDCITETPKNRWDVDKIEDEGKKFVRYGGYLPDIDKFDPLFFNISPKEAEYIDPRQRLFLQEAWKALEDAGYSNKELEGKKCSVFVGIQQGEYIENFLGNADVHVPTGNSLSVIPARISYLLNLKGPSIAIDSACSASLVAISLACESILSGTSEMAIAGGVQLMLSPWVYMALGKTGMFTADGKCKTFDNNANGIVPGEGVGAVILKTLDAALRDGDHIYGVIKGYGMNQDGKTNGLTAPSGPSQTALECEIYNKYKINPENITYVEAHGTGTKLGDPIEVNALTEAFRRYTDKKHFCNIGSVKTNIGHTISAAGISAMIKVLLCIKNRKLPLCRNLVKENELIDFANSPFYVGTKNEEWNPKGGTPRMAAISSFGMSGTNSHVVVSEGPQQRSKANSSPVKPWYLIPVSAKSEAALDRKLKDLLDWLKKDGLHQSLDDISFTALVGRSHFNVRLILAVRDKSELEKSIIALLKDKNAGNSLYNIITTPNVKQEPALKLLGKQTMEELSNSSLSADEYREKLMALADLYVRGYDLEWKKLYEGEACGRISMPSYPFEKMICWTEERPFSSGNKNIYAGNTEISDTSKNGETAYHIMEKMWKQTDVSASTVEMPKGTYIVLVNNETQAFAGQLLMDAGLPKAIVFRHGSQFKKISDTEYTMDFGNTEEPEKLVNDIAAGMKDVCGIIDLFDVRSQPVEKSEGKVGRVVLVQNIIKKFMKENFPILHFTRGIHGFKADFRSLCGAEFAGFAKMLSAEYVKLRSRTIDIDMDTSHMAGISEIVLKELKLHDMESEICYRGGTRYAAFMKEIYSDSKPGSGASAGKLNISPDKVIVITGGTRGVGSELAKHLIDKGAKKLVLMGVQQYPPRDTWEALLNDPSMDPSKAERIRKIIELEKKGAKVELYCGSLTDNEKLSRFFREIRQNLGEIGGVIHCAGLNNNNNPAFIYKSITDIQKVFEPKVPGVETLHDVFKDDKLDYFILFSSLSSQLPLQSVALSDYAAANYYMDCFAAYQHAKGNTYYKSIVWPSWLEVGMLVDLGVNISPVYSGMGLTAHSLADGFKMLEDVMAYTQSPSIFPCIVNKDKFNSEVLLLVKQVSIKKSVNTQSDVPAKQEAQAGGTDLGALQRKIREVLSKELRIPENQIHEETDFADLGVDSILLTSLVKKFEDIFCCKLDPGIFLEYPNLKLLSTYLQKNVSYSEKAEAGQNGTMSEKAKLSEEQAVTVKYSSYDDNIALDFTPARPQGRPKIAVIGIACNFPGAKDKDSFWHNLANGRSSIIEVPKSRWDIDLLYSPAYEKGKIISKWGGFIEDIEYFDPGYFGISEEDAPQVSPLVRQFLEASVQVIRDAGYDSKELSRKKVGVFVGAHAGTYPHRVTQLQKSSITGIGQNFIAAHVSHFLNFTGPSFVMDSACSSSLLSIHLACHSIMMNESEMAIAGGVDILLDEKSYGIFNESRALSPDGKCHTFDEKANGIVPGEGCGALLLKSLEKAIADGDRIYAVIEASATNNDGRTMGITTPNAEAQSEVIKAALESGAINPRTIGYVENHGTGTMIGDPIELKALTKVYNQYTEDRQFCGVGSVKTNIGHCLSAAGVASFIKTVLAIYNKQIPPTLNCENPNPRFEFKSSPFYPNTTLKEWEPHDGVRRAGISAFGFGGTNVHMIVGECHPSLMKNYSRRRETLPPAVYNKKRYWTEKENNTQNMQVKQQDKSSMLDFIEETI